MKAHPSQSNLHIQRVTNSNGRSQIESVVRHPILILCALNVSGFIFMAEF